MASSNDYKYLVENAYMAIVIADKQGKILYSNWRASIITGIDYDKLREGFLADVKIDNGENLNNYISENILGNSKFLHSELILKNNNGEKIPIELHVNTILWSGNSVYSLVFQDISIRKQMEEALRRSEESARALMDATEDSAMLEDLDFNILTVNKAGARRLNKNAEELIGKPLSLLLTPELAKSRDSKRYIVLQTKKPVTFEDTRDYIQFKTTIRPVFNKNGEIERLAVFAHDVTDVNLAARRIKDYQEQLRSLAAELFLAEERERRRISTYLHDNVGQVLAMCKIRLTEFLGNIDSENFKRQEVLEEIYSYVNDAINTTRTLTFELSPPVLYELGFEATLEWLVEQFRNNNNINIELFCAEIDDFMEEEIMVTLFQIVREVLINVTKHAKAQNIAVSINNHDGFVTINVSDDGIGFDTSNINNLSRSKNSYGLFSIQERLHYIGGEFHIQSSPGYGTHVTLKSPMRMIKEAIWRMSCEFL